MKYLQVSPSQIKLTKQKEEAGPGSVARSPRRPFAPDCGQAERPSQFTCLIHSYRTIIMGEALARYGGSGSLFCCPRAPVYPHFIVFVVWFSVGAGSWAVFFHSKQYLITLHTPHRDLSETPSTCPPEWLFPLPRRELQVVSWERKGGKRGRYVVWIRLGILKTWREGLVKGWWLPGANRSRMY